MGTDGVREIIDRIADGENAEALLQSVEDIDKKELEYLMPALSGLAELRSIQPDDGLMEKIKAHISEGAGQGKEAAKGKLLVPRFGFKLRPLAILAAMMLLGTGTAFASTSAMPDSILYPVKKAIESVSKNISNDKSRTIQILTYNQRRIEEIKYLKTLNDGRGIGQLVKEINMNIKELKALLKDIAPGDRKDIEDRLAKFLDNNQRLITKQEAKTLKRDSRPKSPVKEIKDKAQDKATTGANNNTVTTTDKPGAASKVTSDSGTVFSPVKPTPSRPVGPSGVKK